MKNRFNFSTNDSKILEDAREYVANKDAAGDSRPLFHVSPSVGWMNDPNGFSYFNGQYHLFYQYYPYDTKWNDMHWGHAVSEDLIKWQDMPIALAPDEVYDEIGCFSGTALEVDGQHVLMYTNVRKLPGDGQAIQEQALAIGDGVDYRKIANNPIISYEELPEGFDIYNFRDPKLIRLADNKFLALMVAQHPKYRGAVIAYKSENLVDWKYVGLLDASCAELGDVWECPDFFKLSGKDILLLSPQDAPENNIFHQRNSAVFFTGEFDLDDFSFEREAYQLVDAGFDFYAPQTMSTVDGRRVILAWMSNWNDPLKANPGVWNGQQSLVRELSLEDGHIYQRPLRELENYRLLLDLDAPKVSMIDKNKTLFWESLEIDAADFVLKTVNLVEIESDLKINLKSSNENFINLLYNSERNCFELIRSIETEGQIHERSREFARELSDELELRFIIDKYSIEIFIDNGRQSFTSVARFDSRDLCIELSSANNLELTYELYELR